MSAMDIIIAKYTKMVSIQSTSQEGLLPRENSSLTVMTTICVIVSKMLQNRSYPVEGFAGDASHGSCLQSPHSIIIADDKKGSCSCEVDAS